MLDARPQANLEEYNRSLQYTLGSKLFFLPHIPLRDIRQFVDFGCADAALLKLLHAIVPTPVMIGIEADEEQRKKAARNFPELSTFHDLEACDQWLGDWPQHPNCVIFTSVLHEVCSVGKHPWKLKDFWPYVESFGFDYIVIRDFSVPRWCKAHPVPSHLLRKVYASEAEADMLRAVSRRYGSADGSLYNFVHYLLKRPYVANWDREMQEDYLFADTYTFYKQVTESGRYAIKHIRNTRPKFFSEITKAAFGECPDVPTHIEIVLERTKMVERLAKV